MARWAVEQPNACVQRMHVIGAYVCTRVPGTLTLVTASYSWRYLCIIMHPPSLVSLPHGTSSALSLTRRPRGPAPLQGHHIASVTDPLAPVVQRSDAVTNT